MVINSRQKVGCGSAACQHGRVLLCPQGRRTSSTSTLHWPHSWWQSLVHACWNGHPGGVLRQSCTQRILSCPPGWHILGHTWPHSILNWHGREQPPSQACLWKSSGVAIDARVSGWFWQHICSVGPMLLCSSNIPTISLHIPSWPVNVILFPIRYIACFALDRRTLILFAILMKPGTFEELDRTKLTMIILFSSPDQQMAYSSEPNENNLVCCQESD